MGLRPWLLSPSTSSQWKALVVGTLAGPLPQSSRRSRDHAYNHSQATCQLWQAYHLPGRYAARPVSRLTSLHPAWDPATLYNALLSPSLLGHFQHSSVKTHLGLVQGQPTNLQQLLPELKTQAEVTLDILSRWYERCGREESRTLIKCLS